MSVGEFGEVSHGPIFLDQLDCVGQEISLTDCDYSTNHMCTHQRDVGITCHRKL